MDQFNIYGNRSDLIIENQFYNILQEKKDVFIVESQKHSFLYKTIYFHHIHSSKIKNLLKKELSFFIHRFSLPKQYHVFIVGIGNDNHTADSVGPKTLKHIVVNSHLKELGMDSPYPKVSALEPGVLGETGIETTKIIKNVVNEIKPDFMIIVDSYVSRNIQFLNQCIQLTDEGITPGSGIHGMNTEMSFTSFGIPILVIGVPTAIEVNFKQNNHLYTYLLSTKDIDTYVNQISKIIGESINETLYYK